MLAMKPERTRDQLKSVGIARARMYLKGHLDWLDGAPIAQSQGQVLWRLRPQVGAIRAETIVVDRQLLRDSHVILQKLTRQFPHAMSHLVGDISEWSEQVTTLLDRLKRAVHDNIDITQQSAIPLESLTRTEGTIVDRLLHQDPAFAHLLKDVIWSGCYNPAARSDLLHWINDNEAWILKCLQMADAASAQSNLLLAGDLSRTGSDEVTTLIQLTLARPDCFHTVTAGLSDEIKWFTNRLRDWRNPKTIPTRPRPISGETFGQQMALFLRWLAAQPQPVRQRATRLAKLVMSASPIGQWTSAWEKYHSAAHAAIRGLCQQVKNQIGSKPFHAEACRVAFELEKELADEPPRFPLSEVLDRVKQIAVDSSPRFQQGLCDLLGAVPGNENPVPHNNEIKLTLALLREATQFTVEHQAIRYFELSRQYLQSSTSHNRLRPWQGLLSSWDCGSHSWSSPRITLIQELPRHAHWWDFYRLLNRLVDSPHYHCDLNCQLAWLQLESSDVDQTHRRSLELAKTGILPDCSQNQLRAAIELEADDFPLAEVLHAIGPNSQIDDSCLTSILKLHRNFKLAGWPDMVRSLLRTKRVTELSHVALQFQISSSESDPLDFLPRPTLSLLPDWAQHLPPTLQSQISLFTAAFPQSRIRIQKILDKHFPDSEQLQNEIAVLQRFETAAPNHAVQVVGVGSATQVPIELKRQRRLANLQQRLHLPRPVSESEISRLQQQLADALVVDLFHDAQTRIVTRLTKLLGGNANLKEFSRHLSPVRHLELVRGILNLNEPYRTFGLRLLRKCWGNVPWDLQQETPNRRFLDALVARGLHIEPWLSDRELIVTGSDQHSRLSLTFESNEAEQLLMGYYFGTCLSPGDINFFSAVANATDINKRVVYARDPKGEVVGRCLIAIGDAGTIVAFRPYCYDSNLQFTDHIAQFATDLANEMGTVVSHTDHVSPLLSPGWYDDGAYNLGNSITADESAVRVAIREATEQTLVARLESALAPVGLNNSMLEIVVQLPEFLQRPQLIRALIPLIQSVERYLGVSTLIAIARLADQANIRDIAAGIFRRYALGWIRRRMNHGGYLEVMETLKILIAYHPSIALRSLRETRQRHIHSDQDEHDRQRRQLLADCHQALGRPRLASDLRRCR
eukprot:TRINITY_DN451_c0_g1_i5.p1 TRINITY_DN451_c0_g1~~TRINITY_DN451_c0_g1_i5.p1  ORF type:complete len:1140 (-),score=201.46 TRINITY_DN451_c0_g1_i5:4204-7623(-)